MSGAVISLLVIGGCILVVVMWIIATYNGLVSLRNIVQEAWSGIDVQLKRRHDLIPNLVETVKGYASHEQSTLEAVTAARSAATSASSPAEVQQAENMLTGALRQLFALSEAYPDLKANQNFLELQAQLADTEDQIQAARRIYNGNVEGFNTKQQQFPANIIAGMFNFTPADFFEMEDPAEREPVKVSFA